MRQPYRVLRVARWILLGLAYLSSVSNVIGGFVLLVTGGAPVTILVDGPAISARVMGLLSIVISAPLSFLFFYIPSAVLHLLLELRDRLPART